MIIVFDLDDTLYSEIEFVKSGFLCVSKILSSVVKQNESKIYNELLTIMQREGRGRVFDTYLAHHNIFSKKLLKQLVTEYRKHKPKIALPLESSIILQELQLKYSLYLVTDGHKLVQENKILALGLQPYFKRVFITHRYGLAASKPSLKCFEIIKNSEGVEWNKIVYVGDDPNKDFVNLKKVGAKTIRKKTGRFATLLLDMNHEAQWQITKLVELHSLLETFGE